MEKIKSKEVKFEICSEDVDKMYPCRHDNLELSFIIDGSKEIKPSFKGIEYVKAIFPKTYKEGILLYNNAYYITTQDLKY